MKRKLLNSGLIALICGASSSVALGKKIAAPEGRPVPGGFAPLPANAGAPGPGGFPGGERVRPQIGKPLTPMAPPVSSGAAVLELLEDDAARLARGLNANDDAVRTASPAGAWGADCYSGIASLKVTGQQRFREQIAGWNFPIVEKPKAGEFRYLRFAWKKPEGSGIMVQLCVSGQDWGRYFAGQNTVGFYPAQQVNPDVPRQWTVVTRDLYTDFGQIPYNLTGMAFTNGEGAALFDHVYLGRTIEDLDKVTNAAKQWATRVDALGTAQLDDHWKSIASEDAAVRMPSLWALGACASSSVPFIKKSTVLPDSKEAERKLNQAVADLDSPRFPKRERASKTLEEFGRTALPYLEAALKDGISQEWRMRLEKLIAKCKEENTTLTPSQAMTLRTIRVLEAAESADAKALLESLSNAALEAGLSEEAKAALERLAKRKN